MTIRKRTEEHPGSAAGRFMPLACLLLFFFAPMAKGQEQASLADRARKLYGQYEYARAAEIYEVLVDRDRPKTEHLEYLAECYRRMNRYEVAENWYARVVGSEDSKPVQLLAYADVLKGNGKYVEAKRVLQRYADATGRGEEVVDAIAGCDSAIAWMARPTGHRVANERALNTVLAEFSPVVMGDSVYYVAEEAPGTGKAVYGWTGKGFLGINIAGKDNGGRLLPQGRTGEAFASGSYHVGPVAVSADGRTLYVTRTYGGKDAKKEKQGKERYRTRNLELYLYVREGESWRERPFAYNSVKEYSVGHAAPSPDGKFLYFVSDMPGGQGGTDIWYCERSAEGSWGKPQNAGTAINSGGDELFPTFGTDGRLYFSSDGHPGMGNLDIFSSEGSGSGWTVPRNMGYPVNSAGDDFSYTLVSTTDYTDVGFLSSNRKDGAGDDDIYSFSLARAIPKLILRGTTYDKVSGRPLADARASLEGTGGELLGRTTSGADGTFLFEVDPETGYGLLGTKTGYLDGRASASTSGLKGGDTLDVAIYLDRLSEGRIFKLENIYYDLDKSDIRPDAAKVLDTLVATLRDNPELLIELSSHTDSRASHAYNLALSQRRAQSAVDYLVKRGIARDRLLARGYGETRLVNECADGVQCTEEQHQLNRRTEFRVLSESRHDYGDDGGVPVSDLNGPLVSPTGGELPKVADLEVGSSFRLEGIYFDFDKSNIRGDAAPVLDRLARVLEENPGLEIELSAHTDSRGSDAYNQSLSERRAASAVAYLVRRGIAAGRLTPRGYGETQPVNGCTDGSKCSSAEHQLNRRVEVKILKK